MYLIAGVHLKKGECGIPKLQPDIKRRGGVRIQVHYRLQLFELHNLQFPHLENTI